MSLHTIKLPDVGEGIAEAELVEWSVAVGDEVSEDDVLAIVMTDKAAIEVPSSVSGKVMSLGGEVGEVMAIGSLLVEIEIADGKSAGPDDDELQKEELKPDAVDANFSKEKLAEEEVAVLPSVVKEESVQEILERHDESVKDLNVTSKPHDKVLASPAVRARAKRLDIDLGGVPGFGPLGRIRHEDLDDYLLGNKDFKIKPQMPSRQLEGDVTEVKVIGMRRKIAEQMALSKSQIPHITLVEEIDVTALEEFRAALNEKYSSVRPKLTVLPFLMKAMVEALQEQPQFNAHYDDEHGVIRQNSLVSIGIAAQTDNGLTVPVVSDVASRSLWNCAEEIVRLTTLARDGKICVQDLGGGTITLSSLGPLGGIVSTPIINYPQVAIVGVNKIAMRPFWDGEAFKPRKIMNLSSGFDHRIIDGFDAAVFVQKLKACLEAPYSLVD